MSSEPRIFLFSFSFIVLFTDLLYERPATSDRRMRAACLIIFDQRKYVARSGSSPDRCTGFMNIPLHGETRDRRGWDSRTGRLGLITFIEHKQFHDPQGLLKPTVLKPGLRCSRELAFRARERLAAIRVYSRMLIFCVSLEMSRVSLLELFKVHRTVLDCNAHGKGRPTPPANVSVNRKSYKNRITKVRVRMTRARRYCLRDSLNLKNR